MYNVRTIQVITVGFHQNEQKYGMKKLVNHCSKQ